MEIKDWKQELSFDEEEALFNAMCGFSVLLAQHQLLKVKVLVLNQDRQSKTLLIL